MLSDDTKKRIQSLMDKAAEIVRQFPLMSQTDAIVCASSRMTQKEIAAVMERAEKIEERQEQIKQAEMRAKAAYAATFKSNTGDK